MWCKKTAYTKKKVEKIKHRNKAMRGQTKDGWKAQDARGWGRRGSVYEERRVEGSGLGQQPSCRVGLLRNQHWSVKYQWNNGKIEAYSVNNACIEKSDQMYLFFVPWSLLNGGMTYNSYNTTRTHGFQYLSVSPWSRINHPCLSYFPSSPPFSSASLSPFPSTTYSRGEYSYLTLKRSFDKFSPFLICRDKSLNCCCKKWHW